ncbi:MAG: TonB-dependent receptor [Saprospiraceae bacterium]|nr:TonB-dependent receptor [Saprospiraceae bacterium]
MRFWLFLLFSAFGISLAAQSDTSFLLKPDRFTEKDIVFHKLGIAKRKAISATRSLEETDQLPFSVWVVTSEDILRNGFVTLGDVLRAAPGVRVSQPGNTLEGETFMVRGLPGNRHFKVLINDVPIKPSGAPGTSIGAQLPIRQAERIEVLFGPASAIYGDDACGGVVNIILKETERPIFTQADLAFGNFGYNSLDLMLGGKLFKDQKVFRFSLYGSSTVRERTDVFYDDQLFTTQNYLPFGLDSSLYRNNQNYRPSDFGSGVARTAPVPHESRLLGINLTWRNIHFNYNRMQRFDHSALGLSPLAASYANPSNRIAEQIETFALSFQKKKIKHSSYNTLSFVRYKVDNTSTFTPVFDRLSTALYYSKIPDIQAGEPQQKVLQDIFNKYASNERYFTANSIDLRFETRLSAALRPRLHLDVGLQAFIGGGVPPVGYFIGPTQVNLFGETDPPNPQPFGIYISDANLGVTGFGQLHWRLKKLTLVAGTSINVILDNPPQLTPRLAVQYRLDSSWSIFANYASGFRRLAIHERVNTYRISADGITVTPFDDNNLVSIERLHSTELAIRRYKNGFSTNLTFFYQEAYDLARNGYLYPTDSIWTYGYAQAPGLSMSIWGIQGAVGNDLLDFDLNKKSKDNEVRLHGEFYFQYTRGREWFGYGLPSTTDVRNFPRWITQLRLSLRAKKWEFSMSSNRQNGILSGAVVYQDFYQRQASATHFPAYRTWDFMLRIYLSNHFLIYVHTQNTFNKHYGGIDATGTPDDLLYNPQPGRSLRLGVNYTMN